MKQIIVEFSDEEIKMMEEQLQDMPNDNHINTLEDYVYHASKAYFQTLRAAQMLKQSDNGQLFGDAHPQIGVLNVPVQLSNPQEKKEFIQYLNQVINNAIHDFNNRNNGPIN